MQKEVFALEQEKSSLDSAFAQRNSQIESAALQLTEMESHAANMQEKRKQIDAENERLKRTAERLKQLIDSSDVETLMKEQTDLMSEFPPFSQQVNTKSAFSNAADPFIGSASLGGGDPFGSDPFASASSSTFQTFDEPFGAQKDPFGSSDPFASGAQGPASSGGSKSIPPRPAPPKSRQTPTANAEADPFQNK
ncbi:unnamed protein product [Enterobius vermicularis]|uniref:Epidermal growth factor receptor substrate 15-like 1 n=1 Tax=Enterobius vermicularis TaxID=51028 RepID=A0A0N4UVZ5_ENTVE|nr:unnamed protein product [Enterobius vermicularis]